MRIELSIERDDHMQKLMSGIFAAALVMALPLTANAQDAETPETMDVCTATIAPIHAGNTSAVTATFEVPFGEIVAIEAPAESGIVLVANGAELSEMAAEGVAELKDMANESENVSFFRINAEDATPGTYELVLKNEEASKCVAEVTVEEPVQD